MGQTTLTYPDGLAEVVRLTPDELDAHILLMAALKMFELGKLSSGKAAELAGLSKVDFLDACGRYKMSPYNYPDEVAVQELRADVRAAGGEAL